MAGPRAAEAAATVPDENRLNHHRQYARESSVAVRKRDGSAGDADDAVIGSVYTAYRRADPRICRRIVEALGDARTVLNVGAGSGGYEPTDRTVTAVERSPSMRASRPRHLPAATDAVVEDLPFADDSFDAAMATFTVHQ